MNNKLDFFFECRLFHTQEEFDGYKELCKRTILEMLNPISIPEIVFLIKRSPFIPGLFVPESIEFGDVSPREYEIKKDGLSVLYSTWSRHPHHVKYVTLYGAFIKEEVLMNIARSFKQYYEDNKTTLPFSDKELDRELFKLYSQRENND